MIRLLLGVAVASLLAPFQAIAGEKVVAELPNGLSTRVVLSVAEAMAVNRDRYFIRVHKDVGGEDRAVELMQYDTASSPEPKLEWVSPALLKISLCAPRVFSLQNFWTFVSDGEIEEGKVLLVDLCPETPVR